MTLHISKTVLKSHINFDKPTYHSQCNVQLDKYQTASYVCRNGGEKLGILRKRMPEKFQVQHANTERFRKSSIIYMQHLLNENENKA